MTWHAVLLSFAGEIDEKRFRNGVRILLGLIVIFGSTVACPILLLLLFGPISFGQSYSGVLVANAALIWTIIVMPAPFAAFMIKRLNDAGRSRRLIVPGLVLLLGVFALAFVIYDTSFGQAHQYTVGSFSRPSWRQWCGIFFFLERLSSATEPISIH